MTDDVRDEQGRFAAGNPGGPGRPRRAIEREYLAALGEAVKLDDWRDVVARAVADAKAGDAAARAWLAKYLVGDKSASLLDLAAAEARGFTAADAVQAKRQRQQHDDEREAAYDAILAQF